MSDLTAGKRDWLDRPVVLFGGKGGVGKTTCAAAFAVLSARRGARTLLVSTDPAHSIADLFDIELGDEPRPVPAAAGLDALEIDSHRAAERYIEGVRAQLAKVVPARLRPEMEQQVAVAKASPGAEEAALFERVAEVIRTARSEYDRLVIDTAPTGHTLRLLTLPELMQAWTEGLLRRRRATRKLAATWRQMTVGGIPDEDGDPVEQALTTRRRTFYQVRQRLLDATQTAFVFVVTPERLPIIETGKAVDLLRQHEVPVGGLVVNRVLGVEEAAGSAFLGERLAQQSAYLRQIERRFADLPRLHVPLLARDVSGLEGLETVISALCLA